MATSQRENTDPDRLTAAVMAGDFIILNRLLDSGNYSNDDLGKVLVVAAIYPKATKIMTKLLDAGASFHYCNEALRSAVLAANPDNAQFLIQRGCSVTPELLADAVATRKANIVRVILNGMVDPNLRVNGQLAIESAALDDQWHLVKILMDVTDISLLRGSAAEKIRRNVPKLNNFTAPHTL